MSNPPDQAEKSPHRKIEKNPPHFEVDKTFNFFSDRRKYFDLDSILIKVSVGGLKNWLFKCIWNYYQYPPELVIRKLCWKYTMQAFFLNCIMQHLCFKNTWMVSIGKFLQEKPSYYACILKIYDFALIGKKLNLWVFPINSGWYFY